MKQIKVKKGYKYIVADDSYFIRTNIYNREFSNKFFSLEMDGLLHIKLGYACDGVTGFPDFNSLMRGAIIHDCLCQCQREGYLPQNSLVDSLVDKELFIAIKIDKANWFLRKGVKRAMKLKAAKIAHKEEGARKILTFPRKLKSKNKNRER